MAMDNAEYNQQKPVSKMAFFRRLAPYGWMPRTKLRSLGLSFLLLVVQGAWIYLPPSTDHTWYAAAWNGGWVGGLLLSIPFVFLVLTSLLLAASLRRLAILFDDDWGEMLCFAITTALLTVLAAGLTKRIAEALAKYEGAQLWYGLWGIMTIFGLKPILDHLLEKMHPKGPLKD